MSPSPPFETLREVTADVTRTLPATATARQLMRSAVLRCQKGGHQLGGAECLECARIVSIKPSPGRSYLTVRCLWTERDPVEAVMTRAFAAVTIKATDSLGQADLVAVHEEVHHLLVVDGDAVVGVICRCDLADPGSPAATAKVSEHMERAIWTVPVTTTLGEAAEVMERLEVGILMVADGAELLGVITMRDLGMTERGHGP